MNTIESKSGRLLSESEEKLLVRYLDGETGIVGTLRAKYLIVSVPAAAALLDTIRSIGEIARSERMGILESDPQPVDLWDRISTRIHEEERAALYLGGRTEEKDTSTSGWHSWFRLENLAWGVSGGAIAAIATYIVVLTGVVEPRRVPGATVASVNTGGLQRVSASSRVTARHVPRSVDTIAEAQNRVPVPLSESRIPTAVEVDWVKSNGRVRMMQEPNERSAVIWVKRRDSLSESFNQDRSTGREPLVVYGDRIPQSIPVVNVR